MNIGSIGFGCVAYGCFGYGSVVVGSEPQPTASADGAVWLILQRHRGTR